MSAMETEDDVEPDGEEGHALLSFEEEGHDPSEADQVENAQSKRLCLPSLHAKGLLALWLLLCITVFAVAISKRARDRLQRTSASAAVASYPLQEKYVLSPDWAFDDPPATRVYHWNITDVTHNPDGVYRPMMLINNQYPGPLIRCNEGDTIQVHVHTLAENSTSFHWHGIYQNGTNWMDGTVGMNQCPIAPGADFTYKFTIRAQSGTYWYHAHHSMQASDGLLGPLIVHARNERHIQPIEYATDRILMVQDHYHDPTSKLLMQYLQPDQENAEPVPDAALINGRNIRNCDTVPHRQCDNSTSTLEAISLAPNKNHRLRFINVGALAEFQIQVDEHDFAVTEVDGTDVGSNTRYHRLTILPAQRYSIILSTNLTSTREAFWLRARMVTTCFAEENPYMVPEVRAIVQYAPSSSTSLLATPTSRDWPEVIEVICRDLNTTELHPIVPIRAPEIADSVIRLRSNFEIGDWSLSRGFFNQSSWRPQLRSPTLNRIIDGLNEGNVSFALPPISAAGLTGTINSRAFDASRELVFQSTGIQTFDILISNFDDGAHPFHLHGYKFFVLAAGRGYPSDNLTAPGNLDLSNPLRRDTATVEGYGWALLRFVADNPGVWGFHCHISWHAEAGLAMVFWTRAEEMANWRVPEESRRLCGLPGAENGKGPEDGIWYGKIG
jgi:FtsP/CotA-like multicopper oxidase with cupredoxin domain